MTPILRFQLICLLVFYCTACHSQPSSPYAPEPGVYTGSTLNVNGTMHYTYNPVTGFGVQPGTTVTPGPNLAGDLVISSKGNNKGTYALTKLPDWKGDWEYDAAIEQLRFTGPAKQALRYYHPGKGMYSITMVLPVNTGDKGGVTYYFTRKASKPFPRPSKPNGDLKGLLTVKPDFNTVAFLDIASGKIQKSFAGRAAATNSQHHTIAVGFTDNTSYYQVSIVDPTGKIRQLSSSQIAGYNWPFSNYQFGVLSEDNSKMALMGKTPDSYKDLTYTPGEAAIGVFSLSGDVLGMHAIAPNLYIIPTFMRDGRLVYSPKNGGIAVTDVSNKTSRTSYSNPVNAIAVSPDGKRIAFSEGLHFYIMNSDGSNKRQIICNGDPLEADNADNVATMAFAPGGNHIAVSYKLQSRYGILIVPLDGGNYRFAGDEEGETFLHEGSVISWH